MPYLLVRHRVEDYERWKSVFDGHGATREQSGSRGGRVFRNADDPDEVFILLEWDHLDRARRFTASEDLHDTMRGAGVADRPDMYYLQEAERLRV
jgi:heme-degrading monooxygenase HmoA